MTNFAASLAQGSAPRRARRMLLAPLSALALAALFAIVSPAHAAVTEVAGTKVGLQPRSTSPETVGATPETFANEEGNAVLHGTNVYPIYWDPTQPTKYHHEWLTLVNEFFREMGAASGSLEAVFSSIAQYRDRTNQPAQYHTVFKGSYSDTAKYPTAGCTDPNPLVVGAVTCLTDAQLRQQLQTFIASHGLPTGMNAVYYILTPPGVTVCIDAAATRCSDYGVSKTEEEKGERKSVSWKNSFCSYHGDINPNSAPEGDASTIIYGTIPWTAGYLPVGPHVPSAFIYAEGFDCQDGGWSPVNKEGKRVRTHEEPRELNPEEQKKFEEGTAEEKHATEEELRLEGPHQQEPEQAKGETGENNVGLADLIINQIAQQQQDIVSDPLLNAWQDSGGNEVADECRNHFGSTIGPEGGTIEGSMTAQPETEAGTLSNEKIGAKRYYINNAFSLSQGHCVGGVALVPRFTEPNPVNASEIVGFNGMESSVGLLEGMAFGVSGPPTKTYATFTWKFGDGTPAVSGFAPGAPLCETPWLSPCAASVFHSYQYGGVYHVTLTVTDVAGNSSSVEHDVAVAGPPAPQAQSNATPAAAPAGTNRAGQAVVSPIAAAAVISHSLKSLNSKGIHVRYSVNEQVAGRVEVLLSRTIAKKLHVGGPAATGLPTGTPAQVVIAKAILVTTKGGRSTLVIKLSKTNAKHLAKRHEVSMMLRLVVHNAATQNPATATVLTTFTLTR